MGERRQIQFVLLAAGLLVGAGLTASVLGIDLLNNDTAVTDAQGPTEEANIQQFGSEAAFKAYIEAGQQRRQFVDNRWNRNLRPRAIQDQITVDEAAIDMESGARNAPSQSGTAGGGSDINRIADSNVQVEGLDEPDIVKTDGERFYYAPPVQRFVSLRWEPQPDRILDDVDTVERPDESPEQKTHVVGASEPSDPTAISEIDANGKLLQTGDRLVVFETQEQRIVGFDVSDPENPVEQWEKQLNASLVTAREADGQLYVVTQTRTSVGMACPIEPLGEHAIDCGDVYAPERQTTADSTYTAFSIDTASGEVEDSVSFVGTGQSTVVYMSQNGLYITYTTGTSESELFTEYVETSELVPEDVKDRVQEIQSYNISERSKRTEIEMAVQRWITSLPEEEREDTREEFYDGFQEYLADNQKELTQTTVVNVDVNDESLSVGETGTVPGRPLNQFAIDEYEETLRITTTLPSAGDSESINNLYVLDSESLDREDAVTGMGEGQRVYSVRYEGDRAYVVTFRQVDPFYVIDFDDPTDPEKLGELKLPGFSSYMHSIDDESVLGIGEQGNKVKAALFDVSDPTEPTVADDLILDEWQSGIAETHHAFLIDRRHEVFFLPAGNSGYVVDYSDEELSVTKTVEADGQISRARYVNDYLYVFASDEIIVLDETDWDRETTLDLDD